MAFGCCVLFGIIILGKGDSVKVSLHYFTLFLHSKLVIYALIDNYLTSIHVVFTWMILNLLTFHVIACCIRSDM